MGTGIAFAATWIFNQLAIPFKWFAGLAFWDWQVPIIAMVLCVIFYRPLSVSSMAVIDAIEENAKDWRFHRTWNGNARLSDQQFEQRTAALESRANEKEAKAERYEQKALENRYRLMPGSRRNLLLTADKYRDQAEQIRDEIARQKKLRAEVVKRRDQHGGMQQLLDILDRLNSHNSREALDALQTLNGMQNVDWSAAITTDLPNQARSTVIKCLRLMTGTTVLNEARNAYAGIAAILRNHRMSWEDIAS